MATSITNTSVTTDDLTVDTNVLKVNSANNRVGIGTATPNNPLEIAHTGSVGAGGLRIGDPSTIASDTGIYLRTTGDAVIGAAGGNIVFDTNMAVQEDMRIDSSGRVTMPNQPSFLMKKYSGGTTAIANNSVWTYDEALSNVGGHANISNGRFTAPVAGSYCFMWHNIGEGSSAVYRSFIRKNASSTWGTGSYRLESRNYHSAGYPNASAQVVVYLNASDYVDIYVSGGSLYSDTTNGVWFCGFLIG